VQGAFAVANKLYGITFTPRPDLPVYHPEVKAYEVKERTAITGGVFTDYHPRPQADRRVARSMRARPFHGKWCARSPQRLQLLPPRRRTGAAELEEVNTLFTNGPRAGDRFSQVPYPTVARFPRDFVR